MVQGQFNFDRDAYLQARPDVGRAGVDPYQHFLQYGKNEGMEAQLPNLFNQSIKAPDPTLSFTYDNEGGRTAKTNFFDPNEYSQVGRFVARPDESGQYDFNKADGDFRGLKFAGEMADENGNLKALYENEDGLGYTFDFGSNSWEGNQYNFDALQQLKKEDPNQYYRKVGENYRDEFFNNWKQNRGEANAGMAKLEKLKETNPYAYYVNKIDTEAKQAGWNFGQNRADRAEPFLKNIQELAPEAIKYGVSPQELDAMVNKSMNDASVENQNWIRNRKNQGFSLSETLKGIAPIAAFAIGAPLLHGALAGMAAGSAGGGFGLTGAAGATKLGGAGGLLGAGSTAGIAASNAAMGLTGFTGSALAGTGSALAGAGSALAGGAGALGAGFGTLSSALPAGTILGTGLNGGAIGKTYLAAGAGQIAKNALGAPILYNGSADYGTKLSELLKDFGKSQSSGSGQGGRPAGGVGGGGGGANPNIAAILNSNFNLEQAQKAIQGRRNPFANQPIETVVRQDLQRRNPNFGLSNLLRTDQNG